ncbi:hypothetical protein [Kribbella deserti]|uniref:Uncharacterized protein n=1 Tax=Kribbella deserti TaxID=1926257 RepID=A0ABV6QNI2_9ACTN
MSADVSDRLLRLYPATYRAAYGDEIAEVHRLLTDGLPRLARFRADADLLAHALRVRLRLDSASSAGRLFAIAAPFALAVAAANSGMHLMRWYAAAAISPGSTWSQLATTDAAWAFHGLLLALVIVGAIAALTGRWVLGAGLAVFGLAGTTAQLAIASPVHGEGPTEPIAAILTVIVILACPPDLRGDKRLAAAAGATAAVTWFPVALIQTRGFIVSTDYGAWPLLVLAFAGAAVAIQARSSGLREMGAMALAAPLFLAHAFTSGWLDLHPVLGVALLLLLPLLAAFTAVLRTLRR